jgi:hypothetical protein
VQCLGLERDGGRGGCFYDASLVVLDSRRHGEVVKAVQSVVPSTLGPRPATGNSRWPRSRLAACTAEPGLPSTTHRPLHCMWYAYVNKAHAVAAARPTNFRSDRTLFNACMPYATRWPAIRSSICSDRVVCLGTFPSRPLYFTRRCQPPHFSKPRHGQL